MRLFRSLVVKLILLTNDEELRKTYGFSFSDYISNRKNFVHACRKGANQIEKVVRDTGIAKTVGGAVTVASGALSILGVALAPCTGAYGTDINI